MTILYDIGAYKGEFTRQMIRKNPSIISYMFEANTICKKPADLQNHHWFNTVLSRKDVDSVLFYSKNGTGDSYYKETDLTNAYADSTTYQLSRRETKHLSDFDIPLPDIIKIDTQGSELDILSDCKEILNSCNTIYCEIPAKGVVYNYGAPSHEEYIDFFKTYGFYIIKTSSKYAQGLVVQHDVILKRGSYEEHYITTL